MRPYQNPASSKQLAGFVVSAYRNRYEHARDPCHRYRPRTPETGACSLSHGGPSELIVDAKRGEAYRQSFSAPGKPRDKADLVDLKQILQIASRTTPDDPMIDIGLMAAFASRARASDFPADPTYIRAADAKPQLGFGVARK